MTEPNGLKLAIAGSSVAVMAGMIRRIVQSLPRWRSKRITYRIPDPAEVEKPDLWCCEIGGRHYMTNSREQLERLMDQATQGGDHVGTPVLVRWHGRVRTDVRRCSLPREIAGVARSD